MLSSQPFAFVLKVVYKDTIDLLVTVENEISRCSCHFDFHLVEDPNLSWSRRTMDRRRPGHYLQKAQRNLW